MPDLLLLSIASPLLAALLLLVPAPLASRKVIAGLGFALPAFIALYLWSQFSSATLAHGYAFGTQYDTGLKDALGISLHLGLNGISLPLFLLAGLVGLAAGLYALQSKAERPALYLGLLLVMQAGLMGVFASIDVFFFYFFHELALIPTFIMVGIWGGRDRSYAAMKLTIYLTIGAMISLLGLIALYHQSGAENFDLIALRQVVADGALSGSNQNVIFGLLLVGFGILVSLFPFHTWAPLGYGAAPSSAAMLHAGVLKKFGLYGLIQIAAPLLPSGVAHWAWWLGLLAVGGNILYIGFVTIAQRDLKQMIGYSSVMHMGYAFLGIAAYNVVGIGGVVLMMVAHGFSVALLFLLSTSIYHRTQTFDMDDMGGLAQKTPVLAAFFVTATLASIGLPGLANFWGELAIFVGAWSYSTVYTTLAVSGVIISAIYGLRSVSKVFFGDVTPALAKVIGEKPPADLSWGEKVPALLLLSALLVLGFWPKAISGPVNTAVSALYGK
ncbi:NADH-quinone oxidoreductase subunit N [Verrucomicrobia bacterium IMCC26134]|nr:NADH-quinone oxidoreductase subunit N [Verrucomicrobia bacterium IMCC26134]